MTDTNPDASVATDAESEAPETSTAATQAAADAIDPNDHARVAAEYKDKLLRVLAEMENLRRRTERSPLSAAFRRSTRR